MTMGTYAGRIMGRLGDAADQHAKFTADHLIWYYEASHCVDEAFHRCPCTHRGSCKVVY